MYRIMAIALLAAFALTVGATADDKKDDKKEVKKEVKKTSVVKFELLKSGHMAVDVKVNGKGPYTMIFDTGAPVSLVNTKLAKEAGLPESKEKNPIDEMIEQIEKLSGVKIEQIEELLGIKIKGLLGGGARQVKTLEVGDAKVNDVSVMVMDHPTVEALSKALGKPIYGLVGFPFFAQFEMTLDYEKKTMSLTPNGYKPTQGMENVAELMQKGPTPRTLAPSAQWGVVCGKNKGDEEDGIDVKMVVPDSAADKGGIKKGDRLLTLDGRWTDSVEDLYEAASYVKPGKKVKVKVKRENKELVLEVTPSKGM